MGKKLSDDVLKFIVEIDGKPAQQGLNLVEQETRKLEKSNKLLATEMAKLEANGKKGTAEWKAYEAQIKTNNTSISELKKKQSELRQEVGISNLTVKQLRQEYRRLKQAQDGADPNSKEWKQYETQLKAIKGRLNELNGAQRKTNGLFGSLKTLMPAMGLAAGVALFSRLKDKIFSTRSEFEKYEAVLTTTFGSQKKAQKEMDMLVDFASKTPFQLNELTGSFVKLTNYGMQPTRKEMESMGDTAASVGKSFDQFAEAIADAATGENERLKEFGIRAAKHGDKIAYTFKGITTEVDNNTESIKKYLFSLGDMEGVAGSMAAISKTMGGQASNLADSFDQLWNNLGKGVAGGIITGAIKGMNSFLGVVNDWMAVSVTEKMEAERIELIMLETKLYDTNLKYKDRVILINELKTKYPGYLGNIDAETISNFELSTSLNEINEMLINKIILQREDDKIKENNEDAAKARIKLLDQEREVRTKLAKVKDMFKLETTEGTLLEQYTAAWNELSRKTESGAFGKRFPEIALTLNKEANLLPELMRKVEFYDDKVKKALSDKDLLKIELGITEPDEETTNTNGKTKVVTSIKILQDELAKLKTARLGLDITDKQALETNAQEIADLEKKIKLYEDLGKAGTTTNKILTIKEIESQNEADLDEEAEKYANYDPNSDPYIQMYVKQDSAEKAIRDEKRETKKAEDEADAAYRDQKMQEELEATKKHNQALVEAEKKRASEVAFITEALGMVVGGIADGLFDKGKIQRDAEIEAITLKAQTGAISEEKAAKQIAAIKTKQAKADKKQAMFNIILSTAEAVAKVWGQTGIFGMAAQVPVLIMGAIRLGIAAAQPIPEFADGNLMDVIGSKTGRKYKASLSNGKTGIFSKPTFLPGLRGIAGERDPELVLSGAHTRNIQNNYPELLDAIAHTMPEYAAGNVSSTNTERTYEKTFTDPLLLTLLQKLDQRLNEPIRTELVANENYLRTHNKKQAEYEAFRNRIG